MVNKMQRPATIGEEDLSPSQSIAMDSLLTGSSVSDAAMAAKVSRTTVHRWLKHCAEFQAAYNARRMDLRTNQIAQMEQILTKAISAVDGALDRGDAKVALVILHGLGLLPGKWMVIGSDDPEIIEKKNQANKFTESLFL